MCTGTSMRLCSDVHCSPCFEKSFASHEKSKYLLTNPRTVFKSSHSKLDFMCDCGHAFTASLGHVSNGKWCPYCSHNKLCDEQDCEQCFEKSFASHEKSKYLLTNPRTVFKSSGVENDFMCDCGHAFPARLADISNGRWCPYCSKPPKKLCEYSDCEQCFKNSFSSHEKSKYLVDVDPRTVFRGSDDKFDFMCECGHAFPASLMNVINGKWCPYCSHNKLCEYSDCEQCFKNSFASHEKSKYILHVDPRTVIKFCGEKHEFICECGHAFSSTLNNISNGHWCPYCTNQKLCELPGCEQCFTNSFASHEKSKYLVDVDPRTVFKFCNKKFDFTCECGHAFSSVVANVAKGSWCPHCKHKTEDILCTFLERQYSNVQRQFSPDWCKRKRFDVVIHDIHVIIELDGPQHIDRQIPNWASPEDNKTNDMYKMKCANENGYSVVRILQEDVLNEKYDWKSELANVIHEYSNPTNVFLCKNDEYNGHFTPST